MKRKSRDAGENDLRHDALMCTSQSSLRNLEQPEPHFITLRRAATPGSLLEAQGIDLPFELPVRKKCTIQSKVESPLVAVQFNLSTIDATPMLMPAK